MGNHWRNLIIFFYSQLVAIHHCSDIPETQQIIFIVKTLTCTYNDTFVENVDCELKTQLNGSSRAHIGADLLVRVDRVWLRTRSSPKSNTTLGHIELMDDLCRVLTLQNGLLIRFLPIFFEIDESLVHPCPYEPGRIILNEYEKENYGNNAKLTEYFPPDEYDILFQFFDTDDETIFQVNVGVEVLMVD